MSTLPINELKKGKTEAKKLLGKKAGVEGFGIGDQCIRIYITDCSIVKSEHLPKKINNIPIQYVVSGEIKPMAEFA